MKKKLHSKIKMNGNKLFNQLHMVNFKSLTYKKMLNCLQIYFYRVSISIIKLLLQRNI